MHLHDARMNRRQKIYHQIENPVDYLRGDEIYKTFRFDRQRIDEIVNIVREDVEYYTGRSRTIPAAVQVPIALQYLAGNA